MASRVLQHPPRLPSHLHAAAIANGHLLPDPHQSAVLPLLDNLIHRLPSYDKHMHQHSQQLQTLEQMRSVAIRREDARTNSWLKSLSRLLAGVSTTAPSQALPNRYYRLPDPPVAPNPPQGLYLHGDVGCGKSLLMDMVFNASNGLVQSAARVHYHAFMTSVYQMIHRYDRLTDAQRAKLSLFHPLDAVVGRLGRANAASSGGGLLCFDEFQVADVADARLMHGIFYRLLRSGTVVCFTANRAPADVNRSQLRDKDFLPFLDLLHERCQLIELSSGVDYRAVLSAAEKDTHGSSYPKTYFSVDDEQGLHRAWRDVTDVEWDDVQQQVVPVAYGRTFRLTRMREDGSAAQLTTGELLESAVGASDYRALVRATRAIFIQDIVPVFTSDTRNFARRFITLIDVCYEERVRLFMRMEADKLDELFAKVDVSAFGAEIAEGLQFESEVAKEGVGAQNRAVSSSTLYTGEDEAFAFRRAISRLKEMQTAGFGNRSFDVLA